LPVKRRGARVRFFAGRAEAAAGKGARPGGDAENGGRKRPHPSAKE
jgi:hypothetical protein